jgi:hypothetical protein
MRVIGAAGFISSLLIVACATGSDGGGIGGSSGSSTNTGGTVTGMGGDSGTTGGVRETTGGTSSNSGGASASTGGAKSGSGGASSNTGGSNAASGGAKGSTGGSSATTGGSAASGAPAGGALVDNITVSDVTVAAGVKAGVRNYRIWTSFNLKVAPVYTAPRANCGTLVCYTTGTASAPNARVARLGPDDKLVDTLDLGAGLECRGIAAEPDGHFAALLWDNAGDKIFVKRYDNAGMQGFSTELTNSDNHPTDFGIGESRLEFGAGKYGAYYHVHSDSGHEGDTLKYVAAETGAETTTWSWGCSHSMSDLLSFNSALNAFLPVCVTDCYPGTGSGDFAAVSRGGIFISNSNSKKILDVDAGCNGSVAGELGGAAAAASGWKVVFNAHQNMMTLGQSSYDSKSMNQDIGFASVGTNQMPGAKVWLTSTASVNEADSTIARWEPAGSAQEQYLVGWLEGSASYKLSRVDGAGAFLEGPVDVSAKARWGQRDDPFRQHLNKDVVWAWFDAANATTLHFARLRSGGTATCATF